MYIKPVYTNTIYIYIYTYRLIWFKLSRKCHELFLSNGIGRVLPKDGGHLRGLSDCDFVFAPRLGTSGRWDPLRGAPSLTSQAL